MQTSPDSIEGMAAEEGKGRLGKLGMIPVDLWRRVLPAERVVLMRSVCKIARAEMERVGELAAIVIVKVDFMRDIEKVTERLQEMLKWCRIQNLVLSGFRNGEGTRYEIGAAGAGRLAGVLGQCASLAHLDLACNDIGAEGAGRLAGVLGQCASLAHLNLADNHIGD